MANNPGEPTSRKSAASSRLALVSLATMLIAAPASVQSGDDLVGFRSPSNNIHCMYLPAWSGPPATPATLRCDIRQIDTPPPPRPSSCDLDWGRAFELVLSNPAAEMICAGDTVANNAYPVLEYGAIWQHGGFTCTSKTDGVECFNARRAGFRLSRGARTLF